jgi:hypothetical protein
MLSRNIMPPVPAAALVDTSVHDVADELHAVATSTRTWPGSGVVPEATQGRAGSRLPPVERLAHADESNVDAVE